jgi:MoaA/NifB/PqqE/SkfB family radical SAM enzyme
MASLLRNLKETDSALRALSWLGRRETRAARSRQSPAILTGRKTIYALERRILEYLNAKKGWGFDDSTPPSIREAFDTLSDALACLIETLPDDEARFFNKKLNTLEKLAKATRLRSYPIRCYFETTNRCNLRCQMCPQSLSQGTRSDMPREAVAQLSPLFKWFEEISLFGFGETFLIDYLDELLGAIPPHVSSRVVTNGLMLTPETNRMIVDRGLKTLYISLDATDPQTYQAIRGVDRFERIKENIRDLVAYKEEKGASSPRLSLSFVAMKRNISQLSDFIRMAKGLGIDEVRADYLTVYSEPMREQSLFYDQARSDRAVVEAEATAKEIDVNFVSPTKFVSDEAASGRRRRCFEPWEFVYFRSDGSIQACCTNPDQLGSWTQGAFHDYWNSPGLQEMRRTLETSSQSSRCRDCVHVCIRDIRKEASHIHIIPPGGV